MRAAISDELMRQAVIDSGIGVEFEDLFELIGEQVKQKKAVTSIKILTYAFDSCFLEKLKSCVDISDEKIKICFTKIHSISNWSLSEVENNNKNFVVINESKIIADGKKFRVGNHSKAIIIEGPDIVVLGSFNATIASTKKIESVFVYKDKAIFEYWRTIFDYLFDENKENWRWKAAEWDKVGGREILPLLDADLAIIDLFDFQKKVIDKVIQWVEKNKAKLSFRKGKTIKMPTGTGKTVVGAEIVNYWLKNRENNDWAGVVLWIAPREELLEQAIVTIGKQCAQLDPPIRLGYYKDRYNQSRFDDPLLDSIMFRLGSPLEEAEIIFTTFHSANILEELDDKNKIGLMVVDECHRFHSEAKYTTYIFNEISDKNTIKIGLTGTPVESEKHESFWDKKIIELPLTEKELVDREILSKKKIEGVLCDTINIPALVFGKKEINEDDFENISGVRNFWSDKIEKDVVHYLNKAVSDGRKRILVFMPTINRCNEMEKKLFGSAFDVLVHHSKIRWGLRSSNVRRFKEKPKPSNKALVMLTVQTASEGLDVPMIDCLLLVRPTFSQVLLQQMIGRGLRGPKIGGTKECDIYDFTYILEDNITGKRVVRSSSGVLEYKEINEAEFLQLTDSEKDLLGNLPRNCHWRLVSEIRNSLSHDTAMQAIKNLFDKGIVEFKAKGKGGHVRLVTKKSSLSNEELSDEEIDAIGELTVKYALENDLARKIQCITGLSLMNVEKILNIPHQKQGRNTKLRYAFKWPQIDE
jgi:superfamily II DNA or RNA helicase